MNGVVPGILDLPITALNPFDSIAVSAFYVRYILFQQQSVVPNLTQQCRQRHVGLCRGQSGPFHDLLNHQ